MYSAVYKLYMTDISVHSSYLALPNMLYIGISNLIGAIHSAHSASSLIGVATNSYCILSIEFCGRGLDGTG